MRGLAVLAGLAFVVYVGALIGIAFMVLGAALVVLRLAQWAVATIRETAEHDRVRRGAGRPRVGAPSAAGDPEPASATRTRRRASP